MKTQKVVNVQNIRLYCCSTNSNGGYELEMHDIF